MSPRSHRSAGILVQPLLPLRIHSDLSYAERSRVAAGERLQGVVGHALPFAVVVHQPLRQDRHLFRALHKRDVR